MRSLRCRSLLLLVMVLLAACDSPNARAPARSTGPGRSSQEPLRLHVHANGLQLSVSETWQVTTTPAGFVIQPAPPHNTTRTPIVVSIQLLATPPAGKGHRVRHLSSGRILRYTLTQEKSDGSGGAYHTVVAFERMGDHWIQYRQEKQAELSPAFELWEIARGLRYIPSS